MHEKNWIEWIYVNDDLSSRICVPNKTKDEQLNVFNMITGINETKTFKKLIHVIINLHLIKKK